jgi:hypothetical protein
MEAGANEITTERGRQPRKGRGRDSGRKKDLQREVVWKSDSGEKTRKETDKARRHGKHRNAPPLEGILC